MSIIAKKPEGLGSRLITPAGTFQAVCYGVWDIGIQVKVFNGEEKRLHQVVISWEINKLIDDKDSEFNGKRYVISNTYTLSLHEKANLRKHLESWRGTPLTKEQEKAFDLESLIGGNCLINIVHNVKGENTYANISSIMKTTDGMSESTIMIPENTTEPPKWIVEKQNAAIEQPKNVPSIVKETFGLNKSIPNEPDIDFPDFGKDTQNDPQTNDVPY